MNRIPFPIRTLALAAAAAAFLASEPAHAGNVRYQVTELATPTSGCSASTTHASARPTPSTTPARPSAP